MHVGTQDSPRTDTDFEVLAQLGVDHLCADPPGPWQEWGVDTISSFREKVESYGISLDIINLPISSTGASGSSSPNVLQGPSVERDREIEQICQLIRNASRAGIPAVKYCITIIGHLRTAQQVGRGGAKLSSFRYSDLDQSLPVVEGGPADADEVWERIDYLLERIVPVAEEYKVRLANHPQDPGIGDRTYRGVARVLGTVEGVKKFVSMHESPYHGLNFCQGTVSEMLEKPGEEIYDVIRYFGQRDKIFNVHFRNIKGGVLDFVEVFPDEGDVDMLRAIRTYKEVDYKYMLMPDHVPELSGDESRRVGFAYCYGYIHAMLQAVNADT
jgi:mannonate dehydratase